jgi:hypothetical protein
MSNRPDLIRLFQKERRGIKGVLAEAVTPQTYGRAFGSERTMDTLGAVIAPLFHPSALISISSSSALP